MVAAIERLVDWVGRATAWLALAIVVLMATNVVLRYLFSYGSVWAQELEWHLLTPFIMLGLAYGMLKGEHVRVDVLYARLGRRTQESIALVSALLALAVSVIIIWLSIKYVQQAYVIDEGSPDPGGLPHRWILKAFIPLGMTLLALQSLAEIVKGLRSWRRARR